jgi:predicted  nucleic acid-binding Zn-ribbon protein
MELTQHPQEILSQQTALDQLAAAWETLNDKVEAKIVETSVIEEKVNKMASEVKHFRL